MSKNTKQIKGLGQNLRAIRRMGEAVGRIRVQNDNVGDNFVEANGGSCCTFWDIFTKVNKWV